MALDPIIDSTPPTPRPTPTAIQNQAAMCRGKTQAAFNAINDALNANVVFILGANPPVNPDPAKAQAAFNAFVSLVSDPTKLPACVPALQASALIGQIVNVLIQHPELLPAVMTALGPNAPQSFIPSNWDLAVDSTTGQVAITTR